MAFQSVMCPLPSSLKSPASRKAGKRLSCASVRAKPWSDTMASDGAAGRQALRRVAERADDRVEPLQHGEYLARSGARLVLDVIERDQVQREQGGPLRLEDPHGVARALLVGLDRRGARG